MEKKSSSVLCRFIDSKGLMSALVEPRKNSRIFAYEDILVNACSGYFRYRNTPPVDDYMYSEKSVKGIYVYVHDGKVWRIIGEGEFRNAIRESLVSCAGDGVGRQIIKSDWVDREGKLMEYAMHGVMESPLSFDPSIVGFSNGVYDFSDISNPVCHPFSERMPVTRLLPYAYDAGASCPLWLSFLHTMLSDRDVRKLQKFFGLGCVDRKMMGQRVEESLWLIGSGANGKSTILNVLRGVFGDWNIGKTKLDSLLDVRNIDGRMRSMALIEGKLFNICEEISGVDIERGSDMFKSLVSGSPQDARSLSRNIWTAYDIPYFVFSMNQLPQNKRMDDAFRRRMCVIDFHSSIRQEDMDRGLSQKLSREYSGIRNWALEGYRMLEEDHFSVNEISSGLTDFDIDMMIQNGQTVDIWKEETGLSSSRHVGHERDEVCLHIRFTELYADYEYFCKNRHVCEPVSTNQFGRDLTRLHFEKKRASTGICYVVYCERSNKFNLK